MKWDESKHPRDDDGKFTDGKGTYRQDSLEPYKSSYIVKANKEYTVFADRRSVDEFFLYDGDKRGLLAKRNSSHGQWERGLIPYQRYVMNHYTADGYSNINSYLRGYDNGEKFDVKKVQKQVAALDEAIANYRLKSPIVVYRSINSDAFWEHLDNFEDLIGTEYNDKAFMSTSPSLDSTALNKDLLMTIKLPAGDGIGAYINEYNGNGDEIEFLLARNSKFLITSAKKKEKIILWKWS